MPVSRFFFHFNKPATQRAGRPQVSVHIQGACHIVDNVKCRVSTEGRIRSRQPRFVMVGRANSWRIENGVMTIE